MRGADRRPVPRPPVTGHTTPLWWSDREWAEFHRRIAALELEGWAHDRAHDHALRQLTRGLV